MAPGDKKFNVKDAFTPSNLLAATTATYGIALLGETRRTLKSFYKGGAEPGNTAVGLARYDGLALLQNSAVLLAAHSQDKKTRRNINGAVVINCLADAAMCHFQHKKHGHDKEQAQIGAALALGIGAYAAYDMYKLSKEIRDEEKSII